MRQARSAIVLGAGLIGMHAAENMAKAKIAVTVVELQPHALVGLFRAESLGDHRAHVRPQRRHA